MPYTAIKLFDILNLSAEDYNLNSFEQLAVGHSIKEAKHLFSNIEDDVINKQIEKLNATKQKMEENKSSELSPNKEPLGLKSSISFDDFSKIDLRVGTILEAEKVEKADKLLKLKVDLGFEVRTIVSGIALHFSPESLIGKQVCVLANLAPRKIKGIESNGMLLMAENADGSLKLMQPGEITEPGSSIA
jgi:methionyl-tRNA synthetase